MAQLLHVTGLLCTALAGPRVAQLLHVTGLLCTALAGPRVAQRLLHVGGLLCTALAGPRVAQLLRHVTGLLCTVLACPRVAQLLHVGDLHYTALAIRVLRVAGYCTSVVYTILLLSTATTALDLRVLP